MECEENFTHMQTTAKMKDRPGQMCAVFRYYTLYADEDNNIFTKCILDFRARIDWYWVQCCPSPSQGYFTTMSHSSVWGPTSNQWQHQNNGMGLMGSIGNKVSDQPQTQQKPCLQTVLPWNGSTPCSLTSLQSIMMPFKGEVTNLMSWCAKNNWKLSTRLTELAPVQKIKIKNKNQCLICDPSLVTEHCQEQF